MTAADHNKKLSSIAYKPGNKHLMRTYCKLFSIKKEILISLVDSNPKKVLDVGCGTGWLGSFFKKKFNSKVCGIDICPAGLRQAKANGLITKEFNLEGKRWPYPSNSFDLVIAGDLIEHLYDTETFIKEAYRVLKKKGVFIVSTPNINCYYNRLLMMFGQMPAWIEASPNRIFVHLLGNSWFGNTGHIRVFNKKVICNLLESFKFKISNVRGVPLKLPKESCPKKLRRFIGLFQKIENLFGRSPRTSSLIIVKAIK